MESTPGTSAMQTRVGPIQLIVLGFPPDAHFTGEIVRALGDLRGRGVVRIIDGMFVRKDADGRLNASIRESDLTLAERQRMGAVVGGLDSRRGATRRVRRSAPHSRRTPLPTTRLDSGSATCRR